MTCMCKLVKDINEKLYYLHFDNIDELSFDKDMKLIDESESIAAFIPGGIILYPLMMVEPGSYITVNKDKTKRRIFASGWYKFIDPDNKPDLKCLFARIRNNEPINGNELPSVIHLTNKTIVLRSLTRTKYLNFPSIFWSRIHEHELKLQAQYLLKLIKD